MVNKKYEKNHDVIVELHTIKGYSPDEITNKIRNISKIGEQNILD